MTECRNCSCDTSWFNSFRHIRSLLRCKINFKEHIHTCEVIRKLVQQSSKLCLNLHRVMSGLPGLWRVHTCVSLDQCWPQARSLWPVVDLSGSCSRPWPLGWTPAVSECGAGRTWTGRRGDSWVSWPPAVSTEPCTTHCTVLSTPVSMKYVCLLQWYTYICVCLFYYQSLSVWHLYNVNFFERQICFDIFTVFSSISVSEKIYILIFLLLFI